MSQQTLWASLAVIILVLIAGVALMRTNVEPSPADDTTLEEMAADDSDSLIEEEPADDVTDSANDIPPADSSPMPTAASSPAATTAKKVTISIEDTGFTPETVTVPGNSTVTFINNGQAAHWPASDDHPTHNILSGFDAERGLATGESYSFTFTKTGTWEYHDHLAPRVTGQIVVE